jgi:predicted amidohydrolase YtcJ
VTGLRLRDVEVDGRRVDVRIAGDTIVEVDSELAPGPEPTIDGDGGALIPGLWDHHVHLLAMAAAADSVEVGPPTVGDAEHFGDVLRRADRDLAPGRWLRGVGYHERVAGLLDRDGLDRLVPDRPVRIQHRSGALWQVNSAGADRLDLASRRLPGVERDADDRPTGRLYGLDHLFQDLGERDTPDLAALGQRLASLGLTGVTDATPTDRPDHLALLAHHVSQRSLPLRVMVTGAAHLDPATIPAGLERGPAKIIIADHGLPTLPELRAAITQARRFGRAVALHCVTRVALVLALAALEDVGPVPGDRIEHGAVIPASLVGPLAGLGLTVVSQPGFIATRGDEYVDDVDDEELDDLYPAARLIEAGIPLGGSSDAPFGHPDPWRSMVAAVHRQTPAGLVIGPGERLEPARALDLFLGPGSAPGGPPRQIRPGMPADLCLLDGPRSAVLADPRAERVVATICAGRQTFRRPSPARQTVGQPPIEPDGVAN